MRWSSKTEPAGKAVMTVSMPAALAGAALLWGTGLTEPAAAMKPAPLPTKPGITKPDIRTEARVVREIPAGRGGLYIGNRPPLAPSRLIKLPIGSVRPGGWLRELLRLEAAGMVGRLEEISPWCRFESNAWADPEGKGHSGWEELPYWLKGYGDLGYVMNDRRIVAGARNWIEAVLGSGRDDGWFGPRSLLTSIDGKPDLWPHMVMLNVLQSFHEASGDPRVLSLMTRYFRWQLEIPESDFLAGYWPKMRAGDNIESVLWLYNRTGERWLLDLAAKLHRRSADWTTGVPDWHGVNIAQGFREPGMAYVQTKDSRLLAAVERNYTGVWSRYGQVPGGMYGADENCRPGYTDPRQAVETCAMVEFTHSAALMTRVTGSPLWADRAEEVAFNTLPAAMTPDLKALHYLVAPNQVQLDRGNKSPGIQNRGTMFSYSPFEVYRCCQHNVSHGWPYYAEELWLATADRGLCASLYSASSVTAKAGSGEPVTIVETTGYPFGETVRLKISTAKPNRFPLYLRVPRWCVAPEVSVNGITIPAKGRPLSYVVLDRIWRQGDAVDLRLPMEIRVREWKGNRNSVSVERGPLTYSLRIGERWRTYGASKEWPEWEVFPTTPWNFGLAIDLDNPSRSITVERPQGSPSAQPFTPDAAPIRLRAKARRISGWGMDSLGLVGLLQPGPIRSVEPEETVTLIPMGCARLRVSQFPLLGSGRDAWEWKPSGSGLTPAASHVWDHDSVAAMSDGIEPKSSNDQSKPRFTWWDRKGTPEWVEYGFPKPRTVTGVEIFWFDDRPGGGCRVPESWRLLYRDSGEWKPVEGASSFGVERDRYNRVRFHPTRTTGLRIEAKLLPGYSAGILQWRVND